MLDWTGRCIAEARMSSAAHFVTLTYGRSDRYGEVDHASAAHLDYRDVQAFLKRLRHKHPCRFFCVGEYGDKKGRAHWHLILFWKGDVPDVEMGKRIDWEPWPHGFSQFKPLIWQRIRYVTKYLHKDYKKDGGQSHVMMSKRPLIGAPYFTKLARDHVDHQLAPQDKYYSFPEVIMNGRPPRFFMKGATLDYFCQDFINMWEARYPGRHMPQSDLLDAHLDRITRGRVTLEFNLDEERARILDKHKKHGLERPWICPPGWDETSFRFLDIPYSELNKTFWVFFRNQHFYWSFDRKGERAWMPTIVDESAAAKRRENEQRLRERQSWEWKKGYGDLRP